MNVLLPLLLILALLLLLVLASNYFVKSASSIAKYLKVPEYVIGSTIVAFGTSLPELIININSSIQGHSRLAVSNVLGSNIANMCLIIGIGAIIGNIKLSNEEVKHKIPTVFLLTAIFIFAVTILQKISLTVSIISLLVFVLYTIYLLFFSRKQNDSVLTNRSKLELFRNIGLFVLSLTVIIFSGKYLILKTLFLSNLLGISESILGVTLIAIGSSLPELVTTVVSVIKKKYELGIGNILGSNFFNLLFVLSVSSLINRISLVGLTLDFIILAFVMSIFLFFSFNGRKKELNKREGIILLAIYILFIMLNIYYIK